MGVSLGQARRGLSHKGVSPGGSWRHGAQAAWADGPALSLQCERALQGQDQLLQESERQDGPATSIFCRQRRKVMRGRAPTRRQVCARGLARGQLHALSCSRSAVRISVALVD